MEQQTCMNIQPSNEPLATPVPFLDTSHGPMKYENASVHQTTPELYSSFTIAVRNGIIVDDSVRRAVQEFCRTHKEGNFDVEITIRKSNKVIVATTQRNLHSCSML